MSEWQPIETAPIHPPDKDGNEFRALVFEDGEIWMGEARYAYTLSGGKWTYAFDGWRVHLDGASLYPTHWMPLPAPPSLPLHGEDEG